MAIYHIDDGFNTCYTDDIIAMNHLNIDPFVNNINVLKLDEESGEFEKINCWNYESKDILREITYEENLRNAVLSNVIYSFDGIDSPHLFKDVESMLIYLNKFYGNGSNNIEPTGENFGIYMMNIFGYSCCFGCAIKRMEDISNEIRRVKITTEESEWEPSEEFRSSGGLFYENQKELRQEFEKFYPPDYKRCLKNDCNFPKRYDVVIFHGGCHDGLAGAYPFYLRNKSIEFYGLQRDQELPDVTGKKVVMVDICFSRDKMIKMNEQAGHLIVLDHHKSSERVMEGLDFAIFDMERSGAQLGWDHVFPDKSMSRHWFIDTIADRDLWKFELPHTKELTEAFNSAGYTSDSDVITIWENMNTLKNIEKYSEKYNALVRVGGKILAFKQREMEIICSRAFLTELVVEEKTYIVNFVSCPRQYRSEVGNILASNPKCDFAATYQHNFKNCKWDISCRATKESSVDLSIITATFGGGGHPKASGFSFSDTESIQDYFRVK